MATTLQEVLGYRNLTGVVNDVVGGIVNVLPEGALTPTERFEGNNGFIRKIQNTRQVAPSTDYGKPPREYKKSGQTLEGHVLTHILLEQNHDPTVLMQLESYDSPQLQEMGMQEISRQAAEFSRTIANREIAEVYSTLSLGAIYVDSEGNLLPSSSGSDDSRSTSWGISNDHNGTANAILGSVGVTWDGASNDIFSQFAAIKEKARKDTGYELVNAFHGSNIPGYFAANTTIANMINGASRISDTMATTGSLPPFGGFNWIPANEAFFVDSGDTTRNFWPADQVVFTPAFGPGQNWWKYIVGSYPVPVNVNITSDPNNAISGSMMKQYGRFSFAHPTIQPVPGIRHVAGHTFKGVLAVPDAIFIMDTAF